MKDISYGIMPYDFVKGTVQILLSKTSKHNTNWDFIKGKIEDGETPKQCCVREVQEETGLEILENDLEEMHFNISKRKNIGLFWINWCRYRKRKITLNKELYETKFFDYDTLPELSKNQEYFREIITERFKDYFIKQFMYKF